MSHAHHHHHDHATLTGRKLGLTIVLNVIITLSQAVGGILSGSLALLSDALHNLSDVLALVAVYVANRWAQKPANLMHTFGYRRIELLAGFVNAGVLIGIGAGLFFEALHKFAHPSSVDSTWVIGLALLSIVLNAVSVWLVAKDAEHNSNVKAAYLHLMTDVMTSIAVLIGGVGMWLWEWYWLDPVVTILIAIYLIKSAWGLLVDTAKKLMLFSPSDINPRAIAEVVTAVPEVKNIHHLHLWQLDDHQMHLEAHIDFNQDLPLSQVEAVLLNLEHQLHEQFGIRHFSLQPEIARKDDKNLIVFKENEAVSEVHAKV